MKKWFETMAKFPGKISAMFRFSRFCRRALCLVTLVAAVSEMAMAAPTGPTTITIDGANSDWTAVLTNPENQATDGEGVCVSANTPDSTDLDAQSDPLNDATCSDLTPSGRDLKLYAYTWDSTNLYMYVQRWSTSSNVTDWWFYLDLDNDGRLQSGEPVLRVSWKGSNQDTTRELYDYVAVDASGDLLSNPSGDGYSMPGSIINMQSLTSTPNGGSADASFMETWVAWSEIGLGAPATVQFHISSSNGTNLPSNIIDNMTGPAGGGLSFVDLYVGKSASVATVWVGDSLSYTVTLTNDSADTDATSVSLDDVLPANVTHVSSSATSGSVSYNAGTHTVVWTGATVAFGGGTATLTINVTADDVPTITAAAGITATNTANNLNQAEADTNATGSNSASVDVTIKPKPDLVFAKLAAPSYSPVAGPAKAIPGSRITYTVITTNQGYGEADTDSIVITDSIPTNTAIYVPAGAFTFTDGAVSSGLTALNYGGASDLTDDVEFFDGVTWNYQPTAGADGCDPAVQQIRLNPKGILAGATGGPPVTNTPSFNLTFTVCVQ
ncbi:MAG: DUF11 domain-containing protein [Gammaproteobacteria bacterium]|nr:DUF11 domain-containing protein [Gammaproteobacteria bacterium]